MTARRASLSGGSAAARAIDSHHLVEGSPAIDLIQILDVLEVPVVVLRRDFAIGYFNNAAGDDLGLAPSDIGHRCHEVAALVDLKRLEQQCSQVMADGIVLKADFCGDHGSFVVRISPFMQANRELAGTLLTFTNVTAFRASLDQAIYERECTKAILNTVADPFVVLSTDQRIQSGNRAFYAMFGVSRDDTQGTRLDDIVNGALKLDQFREQLKAMIEGRDAFRPVEVDRIMTTEGERTLILHAHPLSFPGHSERRILITFQDITARKQAETAKDLRSEEELRRSEAFLAEGQRLSSTGSFSWKVAANEITWSEQLYRIFEFEPGTPVTLERIGTRVHPEDSSLLNDMIDRARRAASDFEYEHRLLLPDGTVKYVHLIAHGTRNRNGQLEYLGAAQDVTQRRLSEEALGQARSELARVSRVKSLAVLTASIAHELNQPLSGIITNASTCLRMLGSEPPNVAGALETARRTIRDGNRASDVLTRLRALFAKKHTATELVDLNDATREVIALASSELQKNRVVVRTELSDGLPLVMGDRVQLQQVVLNLVRNGSDAMNTTDDRPRLLVIRTGYEGDRVRFSVQDAGAGFDSKNADRLFEPFYTTKEEGMGIGLSVSRSIIESHQGRLWATLNGVSGATFTFWIPCKHGPAAGVYLT
jgi:PAS domain S-box-containing protein